MERKHEQRVDLGRDRCPFCHDGVEREEAVVCQACLARHHVGCWDEGGRCSSCSGLERLEPKGRAPLTRERAIQVLRAAGYPEEEAEAVLRSAVGDPFSRPRRIPRAFPFWVEVEKSGEVVIRWEHHTRPWVWLSRLLVLLLPPLAYFFRTAWSRQGGQLRLAPDRIEAVGLFRKRAVIGAPVSRTYPRAQPLKVSLSQLSLSTRGSIAFFDGDEVLYLQGPEGFVSGMDVSSSNWLQDLLHAWQRDELDEWLPFLDEQDGAEDQPPLETQTKYGEA